VKAKHRYFEPSAASSILTTTNRYRAFAANSGHNDVAALDERSRRILRMFLASMFTDAAIAFWVLGPAMYVRHEGDRPIAITWQLHYRLPADLYTAFAAAVA
jgi:hypothetical protein